MKHIKTITQKARPEITPFVISSIKGELRPIYFYEHYNSTIPIHELEQTKKGVYISLWICSKDVKIFLSNADIEIEYYL